MTGKNYRKPKMDHWPHSEDVTISVRIAAPASPILSGEQPVDKFSSAAPQKSGPRLRKPQYRTIIKELRNLFVRCSGAWGWAPGVRRLRAEWHPLDFCHPGKTSWGHLSVLKWFSLSVRSRAMAHESKISSSGRVLWRRGSFRGCPRGKNPLQVQIKFVSGSQLARL